MVIIPSIVDLMELPNFLIQRYLEHCIYYPFELQEFVIYIDQ